MQLEVDDTQVKCLVEYANTTGLPLGECIYQAMDDWIRTVARPVSQTEKFNVVAMLPSRVWN